MKFLPALIFVLALCSACHATKPLSVKEALLANDSNAGKEILLKACFKGNREGAYLVDCHDQSFDMAFEVSNEFKNDEIMTKKFYSCVYRASSPKPQKDLAVVLLGSIRKGKEVGYPPYFVATQVRNFCRADANRAQGAL